MLSIHTFQEHALARALENLSWKVVETAKALQTLHIVQKLHMVEKIAHLDVRTFYVGYTLRAGPDWSQLIARAVFIDLDRGTAEIDNEVVLRHFSVQSAMPSSWPKGVLFNARRCDWRQWALMVWSLLVNDADEVDKIYEGNLTMSGFEFLDNILCGA